MTEHDLRVSSMLYMLRPDWIIEYTTGRTRPLFVYAQRHCDFIYCRIPLTLMSIHDPHVTNQPNRGGGKLIKSIGFT